MGTNNKQLIFTSDKPVVEDKLGTHKHLANLLVQIVKSKSDNPLVVGLFGGWGTGKSSIVKMYEEIAREQEIKNIYIDAWMFSNAKERFGAGLLKSLARELLPWYSIKKFITSIDQKTETWETTHNISVRTWLYVLTILIFLLVLVYEVIVGVGLGNELTINLMIFLIGSLVINGLFEFVLPRTMTTSESRTFDDSYNKIEHFRGKFQEIIQATSHRVISVVVDNLDRVEPSDALEMIRMLKTFVSENELEGKRFILIVPCDEQELSRHINKELYVVDAHEFLRKFFNVSVLVPELIHEDVVTFTKREIDSVIGGIYPSITEDDLSLVSFVISRASRRSPRQVKILINSFISFWQSAGLANTAGQYKGISPLGAVIYVCLSYLSKGKQLPSKFSDVFIKPIDNQNADSFNEFLISIESFKQYISELEWLYLRKLQISEHEQNVPNFVDIYFAVTDLNWTNLDDLITDDYNLMDLINRLDLKVREEDRVTKARFIRWVLSLAADKKVQVHSLPRPLMADIDNLFLRRPTEWSTLGLAEWLSLIDEGLVEYIIQKPVLQSKAVYLLNSLKEKIEAEKRPTESEIRFITKLINITRTEYWTNTSQSDALIGALDGIIFHCISQKNGEFIKTLIENIHVVYYEGTGVKLADELINLYQNENFEGYVVDDVFSNLQQGNKGAYTFAAQYLLRSNVTQKIKSGQIYLIFQSIEILNKLENPLIYKPIILSINQFSQLISDLENVYSNQIRQGMLDDAVSIISAISSAILLARKIDYRNSVVQAQNSLRDQIWPKLIGYYAKLPEQDKTKIINLLDIYGNDLIIYLQYTTLAQLSQYVELNILERLDKDENQLLLVFQELIDLPHFGKAINAWIKNRTRTKTKDENFPTLNPLFRVFQLKAPLASKYEEIVDGISLISNHPTTNSLIKDHMNWLIGVTNWTDKNSVNLTIDKIRVLKTVVSLDNEIKDNIRIKLDIEILKVIREDKDRTWIIKELGE